MAVPPLVVCSVRDIIERRKNLSRYQRMSARLLESFDWVLVHSDPQVVSLADSFPDTKRIAHLVVYTGFVAEIPMSHRARVESREILISVSGGGAGRRLLDTAIAAAARDAVPGCRWRLLAGHGLPAEEFATLCCAASTNTVVERHRPDFPELLKNCRVAVTQAGYNTVLDIAQANVPAVLVPYAQGGETEQTTRADLFAHQFALQVLAEEHLSVESLCQALISVMHQPSVASVERSPIRFDGGADTARRILKWLAIRHG